MAAERKRKVARVGVGGRCPGACFIGGESRWELGWRRRRKWRGESMALETYASEGCIEEGKREKAGWAAPGEREGEEEKRRSWASALLLVFPDFGIFLFKQKLRKEEKG